MHKQSMTDWVKSILTMGVLSESLDKRKKHQKARCGAAFRKFPRGTRKQRRRSDARRSAGNLSRLVAERSNWGAFLAGQPISKNQAGKSTSA